MPDIRRSNRFSIKKHDLNSPIRNSILNYCRKQYTWGLYDCISLLEHVYDFPQESLRAGWMIGNHARVVTKAVQRYGDIFHAYKIILTANKFILLDKPQIKSVFLTKEKDTVEVFLTYHNDKIRNNLNDYNNLLRKKYYIELPYSIMGIVAENNEHLYYGYEGLFVVSQKDNFTYLSL